MLAVLDWPGITCHKVVCAKYLEYAITLDEAGELCSALVLWRMVVFFDCSSSCLVPIFDVDRFFWLFSVPCLM